MIILFCTIGTTMSVKKNKSAATATFRLPVPWFWLGLIVLLLYAPSLNNGMTELDDSIFINENHDYNMDLSNLGHSFERGVFSEDKDTYYRPLLLDSFIINTQFSHDQLKPYHFFNVLLHLIAVILLYYLLVRLQFDKSRSFLLTLIFAVHPVLTQAVSWIPGRNDSLLAIFAFGWMITTLQYLRNRKWVPMVASVILLLCALFTKESAVFIPVAFFFVLWMMQKIQLKERGNYLIYASWLLCYILWWVVRAQASIVSEGISAGDMLHNFMERVPALIQYFGKTILPFNLSVFPMMRDTSYMYGIIAIVLVAGLIWWGPVKNRKMIIAGFGWFLIMLLPVVILPGALNEQDFEHRLYLPLFGILLVLSETPLFTRAKPAFSAVITGVIAIVFMVINVSHQKEFKDPVTFWEAAVKSSPHSGYATMMLAARIDDTDMKRSNELMLKAYALDPDQKYINYYIGKMYNDKGDTKKAEPYLLKELEISDYYETYFQLSHVEFVKNNMEKSIAYMETYLQRDPRDQMATNNYILMLLNTGQQQKAKEVVMQKQKEGMIIPPELVQKAGL